MKITDKIRTGSEWAISDCIVIECDDAILFSEPDKSRFIHGQAKAQVRFNLEEAKKLLSDLQYKIAHYEELDEVCKQAAEHYNEANND